MTDFITYIRRFSTRDILYYFSQLSIEIYNWQMKHNDEGVSCAMPINLEVKYSEFIKKEISVLVTAWDIHAMSYLSIIHSNDYRNEKFGRKNLGFIIDLYRGYENEHSGSEYIRENSLANVFKFLAGMTYEQFKFQNLSWILQTFNRNYHIFLASGMIDRDGLVSLNEITNEKFGLDVDEFLVIELIIWWLCMKRPDPLGESEQVYRKTTDSILTKDNIRKVLDYYSLTYEEVRMDVFGKQCFYRKPFVVTNRSKEYISISRYLVEMQMADALYWLIRDYYKDKAQVFPNKFGEMFEAYVKELLGLYLPLGSWKKIPEQKEGSADFYVEIENTIILFEVKSGIMGIKGKQQNPDVDQIDAYITRNIKKAYQQLCKSEKAYMGKKKFIKVILIYETIMNEHIMQIATPEIFDNDANCYIMTIQELEMLLVTYKKDKEIFGQIIELLKVGKSEENSFQSIMSIMYEHNVDQNVHFTGECDYFDKMVKKLESVL